MGKKVSKVTRAIGGVFGMGQPDELSRAQEREAKRLAELDRERREFDRKKAESMARARAAAGGVTGTLAVGRIGGAISTEPKTLVGN